MEQWLSDIITYIEEFQTFLELRLCNCFRQLLHIHYTNNKNILLNMMFILLIAYDVVYDELDKLLVWIIQIFFFWEN